MINFKIICFFNDIELSMKLISICNNNNYELIFPDYKNFQKEFNNISIGVIIVDMERKIYNEVNLIDSLYKTTYFPIIGYKNKINKKIKEEADKFGFDIVLDKETLKRNLDVIFQQILKEIKGKSKS